MAVKTGRRQVASVSPSPKWQQIFTWGKETAKKFEIKSERGILKLIND